MTEPTPASEQQPTSAVPERFRSTSAPTFDVPTSFPPSVVTPAPVPGWQCPVCGTVYAPTVANCHNAHQAPLRLTAGTGEAGPCCWRCTPAYPFMLCCPTCGNKRCPRANDHDNACTGSNESGQPGSAYA